MFSSIASEATKDSRLSCGSFSGFVEYREDDHVAVIPVYPLIGQVRWSTVRDATPIIWKEPYSSEPIEEQRRRKILERIIEALRFRGCS